jgi:hypothetical protein
MRRLFPANPFLVLLPLAIVAMILTPSIDPTVSIIVVAVPWLIYMTLWFLVRARRRRM